MRLGTKSLILQVLQEPHWVRADIPSQATKHTDIVTLGEKVEEAYAFIAQ